MLDGRARARCVGVRRRGLRRKGSVGTNLVLSLGEADLAEVNDLIGLVSHAERGESGGAEIFASKPARTSAGVGAQGH